MTSPVRHAPRCDFHPMLSATLHCANCNNLQCKLCTVVSGTTYQCAACNGPCVTASQDALEHAVKRQTQIYQRATAVVAGAAQPALPGSTQQPKPPSNTGIPKNSSTKAGFGFSTFSSDPTPTPGQGLRRNTTALPVGPDGKTPSLRELAGLPPKPGEGSPTPGPGPAAQAPLPPPGKKLPPFKCKGHPELLATRGCDRCRDYFCDACAKMIEDNPKCPECAAQLIVIPPELQGRAAKSFIDRAAAALVFPVQGDGKIMLLLGSLMVWGASFIGWQWRGAALGIIYAYLMKICKTSAIGRESPPDWPSGEDFFGLKEFFFAKVFSLIPAILYLLIVGISLFALVGQTHPDETERTTTTTYKEESDDVPSAAPGEPDIPDHVSNPLDDDGPAVPDTTTTEQKLPKRKLSKFERRARPRISAENLGTMALLPIPFYVLMLAGSFYLPMAMLAATLFRSMSALNPIFVFGSIGKVLGDYVGIYILLIVAEIVLIAGGASASLVPIVGNLIVDATWFYLMMIQMRVLGEMYCLNRRKLAWFDLRD